MKRYLIATAIVLSLAPAAARAQSLSQQINAVAQAQAANRAARAKRAAEQQARIEAEQQRREAMIRHEEAVREQNWKHEQAVREEHWQAEQAALAARQARADAWQDKQRHILLKSEKIHLQMEQTLANRENDIITSDLYRNTAKGDLTESQATSNVNISSGLKTLLQDTGTAEIDEATRGEQPKTAGSAHKAKSDSHVAGNNGQH